MANLDDVARIVAELAETSEEERNGQRTWSVAGKGFTWERRFSKADLKRFGTQAPPGDPVLAVRVEDLHEKEAVLAAGTPGIFTIPHFDGYPAILVELAAIPQDALRDVLLDGWRACAPARLTEPPG